jgi:putative copper export protein
MPNWLYLFVNFLYNAGLAIWIGGSLALGALAAPVLFRSLPRHQAGAIFGPTLRRFSRLRVVAILMIVGGAAVKYVVWETHTATPWIAPRWIAVAYLAFAVFYEIFVLEPGIEARRADLEPGMPDDDPRRRGFATLHRRAEVLMNTSLAAAIVALFFS